MVELIDTKELVRELLSRFDHAIFAGLKVNEFHDQQYEYRESVGNARTCQGLAYGVISRLESQRNAVAEPCEGDS